MHSHLTDTERLHTWQAARDNRIQIVIGTRTALFTPMPELGLIIIDEEHDVSFKQMEGVRYSARDSALVRAHSHQIPIVLGSATPSLETLHNCLTQKYTQLHLTQKALNQLPHCVQLVDIRNQTLAHGLAKTTQEVIAKTLENKQQVLIFINRRGFAPVLLCHECGWIADCHACDSHLTLHRKNHTLLCHHCGQKQTMPTHCTLCQSTDLVPVGAGTQRIQQGLSRQYPHVPLLRIDRDHIKTTEALHTALNLIHKGTPQLIIGTQMLAKGHHFPNLGLVVILDTDAGFYNQDFRALERLGQLIVQVSGRTGREQTQGQVLIQTHLPQHPLLNQLIR
ncbi:MAG: primosomal protein N' [Legionella sp. 21-45-4]|nr:MAG: primosomal protein N' [Legionella sp. 21-45-4]